MALRAWHIGYCRLHPCTPGLSAPHAYSDFILFTCVLAFCLLCFLARKLGSLLVGIAAGFITFLSPWGLEACYFSTYTALSLALMFFAVFAALGEARVGLRVGLHARALAMTNQSLLGCSIVVAVVLVIAHWRSEPYHLVVRMGVFAFGMATPFLATEIVGATQLVPERLGCASVQTPLTILCYYVNRTQTERSGYFEAYQHSLFPKLLFYNSAVAAIFVASVLATMVAIFTLAGGDRVRRFTGWLRSDLVFPVYVPGMLAGITLLLIDSRGRPQFSRSYIIAVPFLFMAALFLVRSWTSFAPRRVCIAVLATFALSWSVENTVKLVEFYRVFHGARIAVQDFTHRGERIVCLRSDTYHCFLRTFAELDVVDAGAIPRDVRYVITGPSVPSALEGTQPQEDCYDQLLRNGVKLKVKSAIPFFALYPFITYEDPFATHLLIIKRQIRDNSYRKPTGSVRIWEICR